jgi:hypothetical protein
MNRINNYAELMIERKRLENRIVEQKLEMQEDFNRLKSKMEPFFLWLPVLNIFKNKEPSHPIWTIISSMGIDLLGQKFLSKTNWITRFIVPLLAKGVTSRVISQNRSNMEQISE